MPLTALAPAKINRELRVGAVRPDGFHEIRSRFASIDLSDRITVDRSLARIAFTCDDASIPSGEDNLVVRAAHLLVSRLGTAAGARMRLEKRIPVGAGLGGGSSDGAVALLLLARLWEAELSQREMSELAAQLGSDVPFFATGGEAEVEGRGEVVTPREDGPAADLIVFVPAFGIATAEVYAAHRRKHAGRGVLPDALAIDSSGRFFGPNDLEPAILEVRPEMAALLAASRTVSAEASITGSGSAIVLYRPSDEAVRRLAGLTPGARFFRTRTLSREEHRERITPESN
jgi:4-diphosphocytidyl-2-C-methyl-D-erythritol kinase